MSDSELLCYCRPGFEPELAAELMARTAALGVAGYCRTGAGWVSFVSPEAAALLAKLKFSRLIFARQLLLVGARLDNLPRENRIEPLLAAARAQGLPPAAELWVESADSAAGRELLPFCRKFTVPLRARLKREGLLTPTATDKRLHVFFHSGDSCQLGYSLTANSSPNYLGIRRLKMPPAAPSRSTLKLEEALLTFIPDWANRPHDRQQAVDLGASPGGWTYQLVRHGMAVQAVDNGRLDAALLKTGLVEHHAADGFKYAPPNKVQLLVCDMVESPQRITALMVQWLLRDWCDEMIFNLKLPMKKRFAEVESCLDQIHQQLRAAGVDFSLQAKQLYHDREEITVHLARR